MGVALLNLDQIYYHLGLLLSKQPGREAEAEQAYRKAIDLGDEGTYLNLGNLLAEQLGREAEAEQAYQKAIEAGAVRAHFLLGLLLSKQPGREADTEQAYRDAIEDYTRAIELDPKDAVVYNIRGLAYHDLKEYQRAIEDYTRAIELDPEFALPYSSRGLAHLWLGNIRQAKDDYSRGWKLDRTDINAAWMAEWVAMGKERTGIETAARLEEIASTNPEDYVAHVCWGVASGLRDKLKEGLAELEKATSLVPEWWDAYFWKAMLCACLGQNLVAMEAFEKALEMDLPPILLTPLYWLEKDRPNFFSEYAAPLLARYNV